MSMLTPSLKSSLLLRPWVSAARLRGLDIARWLRESNAIGAFRTLGLRLGMADFSVMALSPAFRFILAFGVTGLFCLLAFAGTGVIGAVTGLLFLLALAAWFLLKPNVLDRLTSVDLLVLAFLASAVISTAFSSFWQTSVIGLAKMSTFVAGYVVFRVISEQGRNTVMFLLGLLAAIGLVESLIGFYQFINHIQPLATWTDPTLNPELQMNRIFGTLQPYNPNLLAGFLTPCFAAAAGGALIFCRKRTRWLPLLMIPAALLILIALVLTGSRGGFLAIGVMLTCMFAYLGHLIWHDGELRRFRWMKPAWLVVLGLSVLLAAGGILSSEKIRTRVTSIFAMREDSSISYRLNVYQSAMNMAKDNPIVGIGPGNGTFKLVYGLYMVPGFNALGAYSVPLEIAVEQGAIGLVIFLSLILVLILRAGLAIDSQQLELRDKLLIGTLLTGILGLFMYGAFDTIWFRPSVNLIFWFMVAALARLTELPDVNAFRGKL